MPRYFMRDTPLQALEQLMMSQPGQKPRGGGMYRNPFHYTPKDVACEYCQNYVRKHPCRLCECTCLEERIEAGVLELKEFVRDCFAPSMGPQLRKRMHQQFRERKVRFFLSDAHRRRWTHWRERCWRLSDRNKAALFLLTACAECLRISSSIAASQEMWWRTLPRPGFCMRMPSITTPCLSARMRRVFLATPISAAPTATEKPSV